MNLFLYLHPNFEAVFKGTSPGKTAGKKGTKSCDSGATKSAPGLTERHAASAEPEEKITKRGQKSSKEGQKTIYITALHFRG